jgi:3-mercaptopyruvate sulfurtransferase SseA
MNFRTRFSIILIFLGVVVALLPQRDNHGRHLKPKKLSGYVGATDMFISVDQVARMVIQQDTTFQLVDLRDPPSHRDMHIPGSINIPFDQVLNPDYEGYLNQDGIRTILYSNGDLLAMEAWMLITRVGYGQNYVMKGGMNEWFRNIMVSEFTGEQISPRENAKFEVRYRARKFFTQMNSLPDSLKTQFLVAKNKKEMELVGGCE